MCIKKTMPAGCVPIVAPIVATLLAAVCGSSSASARATAASPLWAMARADAQQTGVSAAIGPTGPTQRTLSLSDAFDAVVTADGTIVYSYGFGVRAVRRDATILWDASFGAGQQALSLALSTTGAVVVTTLNNPWSVAAVVVANGSVLWTYVAPQPPTPLSNRIPSPLLVGSDGTAYFGVHAVSSGGGAQQGALYAVSSTGQLRWTSATLGDVVVPASVTPDQRFVVVRASSAGVGSTVVVAVDAATGQRSWGPATVFATATSVAVTPPGAVLVASTTSVGTPHSALSCIDVDSSLLLWSVADVSSICAVTTLPDGEDVAVGVTASGGLLAVSSDDGAVVWSQTDINVAVPASDSARCAVDAAGALYVTDAANNLLVVNGTTGSVLWKQNIADQGTPVAVVALAGSFSVLVRVDLDYYLMA